MSTDIVNIVSPCTNRHLAQLWDAKRQERHVARIRSMKAEVDNGLPKGWRDHREDAKKGKILAERQKIIDADNQHLLGKLNDIQTRPNQTVTDVRIKRNPFFEMREKDLKKIDIDNLYLIKRIQSARPAYSREEQIHDRRVNEGHLRRIALYKSKPVTSHGKNPDQKIRRAATAPAKFSETTPSAESSFTASPAVSSPTTEDLVTAPSSPVKSVESNSESASKLAADSS